MRRPRLDIGRVRAFLRLNKIFFETIAATALAFMALVLSTASLKNSWDQTAQDKVKSQPIFSVQAGVIFNDETSKYDNLEVTIRDVGAPVQAFTQSLHSFLTIRTVYPFPAGKEQVQRLPFTGYLPIGHPTGDATGLLCTLTGYNNNALAANLDRATNALAKSKGGYASVSVSSLLQISYTDLFGAPHQVYFKVNEFGGKPMPKAEAEALTDLETAQERNGIHFELSTATPETLLQAVHFPL